MNIDKSEFTVITIATILLIISLVIRYVIKIRRFNRRGAAGLQHFKNYEQAWIITLVEKILMGLSFIIIVLSIIAISAVLFF